MKKSTCDEFFMDGTNCLIPVSERPFIELDRKSKGRLYFVPNPDREDIGPEQDDYYLG